MFQRGLKYNEKVFDDANLSTLSRNGKITTYFCDQIFIKLKFEEHLKTVKVIRKWLIFSCTCIIFLSIV